MHHYRNLKIKFENDDIPITTFFKETTRDQLVIQRLIEENVELKEELEKRQTASQLGHPQFLQDLIQQSIDNNSGRKLSYTDAMKDTALYIFILGGPTVYRILRENLPLPSLTTVKARLGAEAPAQEGELRVDIIKRLMNTCNEPLYVWIAVDETKIISELRYNVNDDTIVGLEMPLDPDGLPMTSFFKFTSIEVVQVYRY